MHEACHELRLIQLYILKAGFISITSLMVGSVLQTFDNFPITLSLMLLVLYSVGYYIIWTTCKDSYEKFYLQFGKKRYWCLNSEIQLLIVITFFNRSSVS